MDERDNGFETLTYRENGLFVEVLLLREKGTAWLSVEQMTTLFGVSERTIRRHLSTELSRIRPMGKYDTKYDNLVIDAYEKTPRKKRFYGLPVVLAIGERIDSGMGHKLARWVEGALAGKAPGNDVVIIYDNGEVSLDVRFTPEEDDVWLTQNQMAELFETTKQNISQHIANIIEEGELDERATVKYFFTVQTEGGHDVTREIECYNLDMILAVGSRVRSKKASEFRRWAYDVLKNYLRNGYVIDSTRISSTNESLEHLQKEVLDLKEKVHRSDEEIKQRLSKLERLAELGEVPPASAFYVGELFDAREFFHKLFASANESIVVIDPYADHALLSLLTSKGKKFQRY